MAEEPRLDEAYIVRALETPSAVEMIGRLQSAALLAVVDAFDRRIARDEFSQLASSALCMHSYLARLHLASSMLLIQKAGKLDQEQIEMAMGLMMKNSEDERKSLLRVMERVAQCPTPADQVH